MVNPHWDETINEDITVTDLPPWSPQQEWGDVGGGGEFTGWKGQEDPPSYRSDWQDYPADEFTGIETIIPNKFRAPQGRGALRGFPAGRRGPGPWNDFSVGYDNPRIMGQDWGEDLLANLDNWELFHLMGNGYTLEEAQEILERQLG